MSLPPDFSQDIVDALGRIAAALEVLARAGGPGPEMNMVRPLADYPGFDWGGIDASVVRADEFGPTHVEYGGYIYTRRSPQNKFAEAIWYSRATGKGEDGTTTYARLISFKKMAEAEPLADKVIQAVKAARPTTITAPVLAQLPAPVADTSPREPSPGSHGEKVKVIPAVKRIGSKKAYTAFWRLAYGKAMTTAEGLAYVDEHDHDFDAAVEAMEKATAEGKNT